MSLQITIPNEFQRIAPINIGYTAGIETTAVSPAWLQKGNEEVNKILVVSNHAKNTFEKTIASATNNNTGEVIDYRLNTPVEVVWESTVREEPEEIPGLDMSTDFNFLMVSQAGPRKNFDNAIGWWVEEFFDQNVGLVVKTNIKSNSRMDLEATQQTIKNIIAKYPDRKCKVYLLHGDLTAGQMTTLYTHSKIKAMINIAHGEGFGLPLFEAAREALPIITLDWSGQKDFLSYKGKNYFQSVEYELKPVQAQYVWNGVLEKESMWAYADQGSYKMTLRRTYKNWKKAKKTAEELQTLIQENFNDDDLYRGFVRAVYGEEIDLGSWLDELEGDMIEYE
jgi:hypothetical protein